MPTITAEHRDLTAQCYVLNNATKTSLLDSQSTLHIDDGTTAAVPFLGHCILARSSSLVRHTVVRSCKPEPSGACNQSCVLVVKTTFESITMMMQVSTVLVTGQSRCHALGYMILVSNRLVSSVFKLTEDPNWPIDCKNA